MLALTLGNCSMRCSTSCIHAVVIPSPADAGEGSEPRRKLRALCNI